MKPACLPFMLLFTALLALSSCQTMESAADIAATIGQGTGVITQGQADSLRRTGKAVARSAEEFTPEQEYYIGRSVGAVVLGKYRAYDNPQVNQYLNVLGQAIAQASDLPSLFGGYHFLILNSDDINAFATPSGLVFVTRGLLRCCPSEDAVAAVLAHEVAHVERRHGMAAIQKARITEALATIATEGARTLGSAEVAKLTEVFGGAITDITNTLINNGYARSSEYEADQAAVRILSRQGYDPRGLAEMLRVMKRNLKPGGFDFVKTHPAPDDRIAELGKGGLDTAGAPRPVAARQKRHRQLLEKI
jgi:predicted Zn-dependent protease